MTAVTGAASMRENINTSGSYESNNINYDTNSSHMISSSSNNVYDMNPHSNVSMNATTGAYQNSSYMNNNTNIQLQQQHQQESFQAQNQGVQFSAGGGYI